MEMEDPHTNPSPSSLKDRLKSSLCLSCCFRTNPRQNLESDEKSIKPSCVWLKSRAQDLPEIKEKLVSQFRGRRHSSQFRYDPLSYSLNFDQGIDENHVDQIQFRNFAARLPPTPPRTVEPVMVDSREVRVVS
ncbi:uncharacterized protein LOC104880693 [Vitis vinifera]|uniref:Uncharacterized protein n=2 Tax=Vitis vinifera TaxID=29760 RepID=A0A438E835_VITVI|nr:uncharacterized protein LOC104880693 [Vitis vinifera]RVW43770.1 hypothetical protein CK203_074125 [Vitis vinifera]RVX05254.1 hypothetical protein CK203_020147 [Vitis vinifera]|eukprot:XP_010656550.2 PREDICTED: uncharacterized protein LOC104880693 [Vitis vinifera]